VKSPVAQMSPEDELAVLTHYYDNLGQRRMVGPVSPLSFPDC